MTMRLSVLYVGMLVVVGAMIWILVQVRSNRVPTSYRRTFAPFLLLLLGLAICYASIFLMHGPALVTALISYEGGSVF